MDPKNQNKDFTQFDFDTNEILNTFQNFKTVINEEILPSTYKHIQKYIPVDTTLKTETEQYNKEINIPLSPLEGNINWLEHNKLELDLNLEFRSYIRSWQTFKCNIKKPSVSNYVPQTNIEYNLYLPFEHGYCLQRSYVVDNESSIHNKNNSHIVNYYVTVYTYGQPLFDYFSDILPANNRSTSVNSFSVRSNVEAETTASSWDQSIATDLGYKNYYYENNTTIVYSYRTIVYTKIIFQYNDYIGYLTTDKYEKVKTALCMLDNRQIIKSYSLYYNGINIYSSHECQVETLCNYSYEDNVSYNNFNNFIYPGKNTFIDGGDLIDHLYYFKFETNKEATKYIEIPYTSCGTLKGTYDNEYIEDFYNVATGESFKTNYPQGTEVGKFTYDFKVLLDLSSIAPILSWLNIIPDFINKLELRLTLDSPYNCLNRIIYRTYNDCYLMWNSKTYDCYGFSSPYSENWPVYIASNKYPMPLVFSYRNSFQYYWKIKSCLLIQEVADIVPERKQMLTQVIQMMTGKWIYPIRYWCVDTKSEVISGSGNYSVLFHISGSYFNTICLTMKEVKPKDTSISNSVIHADGNGIYLWPGITQHYVYIYNDQIASFNHLNDLYKYINQKKLPPDLTFAFTNCHMGRQLLRINMTPQNSFFCGRFISNKVGPHDVVWKFTVNNTANYVTSNATNFYCCVLQDGLLVFSNFNGFTFDSASIYQQYESLLQSIQPPDQQNASPQQQQQ